MRTVSEKLNEKITAAFGKKISELNDKVVVIPVENINDLEYYVVPTVVVTEGGCVVSVGKEGPPVPAASVKIQDEKFYAQLITYAITVGIDGAVDAADSDEHFNYLFIPAINIALQRYVETFGLPIAPLFGTYFCKMSLHENSDGVILTISGKFASNTKMEV